MQKSWQFQKKGIYKHKHINRTISILRKEKKKKKKTSSNITLLIHFVGATTTYIISKRN